VLTAGTTRTTIRMLDNLILFIKSGPNFDGIYFDILIYGTSGKETFHFTDTKETV